jgi:hypothetical protein
MYWVKKVPAKEHFLLARSGLQRPMLAGVEIEPNKAI